MVTLQLRGKRGKERGWSLADRAACREWLLSITAKERLTLFRSFPTDCGAECRLDLGREKAS